MRSRPEIVTSQEKNPETLRLLSSVLEYYWKINGRDKPRCIFLVLPLKPFPRRLNPAAGPLITSHLRAGNAESATRPVYTNRHGKHSVKSFTFRLGSLPAH